MGIFGRGARIGSREQYAVQRKLGEGQFAEVYEVRDISVRDPGTCSLPIDRSSVPSPVD